MDKLEEFMNACGLASLGVEVRYWPYDRRKFEISAFELDEVYWGTGYTIEEAVKELAQKLALGNPAFKEFT